MYTVYIRIIYKIKHYIKRGQYWIQPKKWNYTRFHIHFIEKIRSKKHSWPLWLYGLIHQFHPLRKIKSTESIGHMFWSNKISTTPPWWWMFKMFTLTSVFYSPIALITKHKINKVLAYASVKWKYQWPLTPLPFIQ